MSTKLANDIVKPDKFPSLKEMGAEMNISNVYVSVFRGVVYMHACCVYQYYTQVSVFNTKSHNYYNCVYV